jgi:hypothetical protein
VTASDTENTLLELRIVITLSERSNELDSWRDIVYMLLDMSRDMVSESMSVP